MGWFTKRSKRWELRHLLWTAISFIMFIPVPIHVYPIVMINQATRSKVKSWYAIGIGALIIELVLFGSFIFFFGSMSTGMLLTLLGSIVSYIIGNGILLNQARSYLQRMELKEVRELQWISSIKSQRQLELLEVGKISPQLFVTSLLHWKKQIKNSTIQQKLDRVIDLFQLIERNDPHEADKFIVRHSTLVSVLKKYDELERSRLNNELTSSSKRKLEGVIVKSSKAIEEEVNNLLKSGILELSAESDAYIEALKNRNLLKE